MTACRQDRLHWRLLVAISLALLPVAAGSQNSAHAPGERIFSSGYRFVEMSGEELFVNVCQGCHMSDGAGAAGAGAYPSLAVDANLEAGGYPVYLVLRGRRGMPPFADMMSDDQVAAVVNYLRTHFGNNFQDMVTAKDVRDARQ
ncbi:MAG TPA: cytochrome c [Bradyrhizobium sp.]|nr:cytochrome c [Bradyrhizobium sp.]